MLTCESCGREINPGDVVRLVTIEDLGEETRIIVDDDPIVVHDRCPE